MQIYMRIYNVLLINKMPLPIDFRFAGFVEGLIDIVGRQVCIGRCVP